jgi:hypothetical protein
LWLRNVQGGGESTTLEWLRRTGLFHCDQGDRTVGAGPISRISAERVGAREVSTPPLLFARDFETFGRES